jgi:DNA polymerase III alpha subunit (gram-positive type)
VMQEESSETQLIRVFLDLETEDLSAKTLLQISAISENNIEFNAFINPGKTLSQHCFRFTQLHFSKGDLFRNGEKVTSLDERTALNRFKTYLENLKTNISLVAFNGLGFDNAVLIKHFQLSNIDFPQCVKAFEDPLPCLKKHFKSNKPENFKLGTLAKIFKVPLICAHDSRDDSKCLKEICEAFCKENSVTLENFLKPYLKQPGHYLNKKVQKS